MNPLNVMQLIRRLAGGAGAGIDHGSDESDTNSENKEQNDPVQQRLRVQGQRVSQGVP